MHAYAWYVWRKKPHCGPSFKVRVGKHECAAVTLLGRSPSLCAILRPRPRACEADSDEDGRRKGACVDAHGFDRVQSAL
jgi:hypothetical protein